MIIDRTDTSADVPITEVVGNVPIFDTPERAADEAFHCDDPYTRHDLFETVIVERFWRRMPPEAS